MAISMEDKDKLAYLERLQIPYEKKGKEKYFIFQYLSGAGNELGAKFWSPHSSSRMAFELYSVLAENKRVLDFEFERQLPGLNSGGMGPNMDVFIETEDELIFVESKFTESARLDYINRKKLNDSYLSPAYFQKEKYGRSSKSLTERFWKENIGERFSNFCYDWQKVLDDHPEWRGTTDWFEPKQETCHLSGIFGYLFQNTDQIKGKKIRLYNVFWALAGDGKSELEKSFILLANQLIKDIISLNREKFGDLDFQMDAFSVQEMLNKPQLLSRHITDFGEDVELRLAPFNKEAGTKTRKNFRRTDKE